MLRLVLTAWALSKQAETSTSALTSGSRITDMAKILIVPSNDSVVTSGLDSTPLSWSSIVWLT